VSPFSPLSPHNFSPNCFSHKSDPVYSFPAPQHPPLGPVVALDKSATSFSFLYQFFSDFFSLWVSLIHVPPRFPMLDSDIALPFPLPFRQPLFNKNLCSAIAPPLSMSSFRRPHTPLRITCAHSFVAFHFIPPFYCF